MLYYPIPNLLQHTNKPRIPIENRNKQVVTCISFVIIRIEIKMTNRASFSITRFIENKKTTSSIKPCLFFFYFIRKNGPEQKQCLSFNEKNENFDITFCSCLNILYDKYIDKSIYLTLNFLLLIFKLCSVKII